ncbi:hypothetical protein OQA88_1249 [Cercophora sp. LCS_1]
MATDQQPPPATTRLSWRRFGRRENTAPNPQPITRSPEPGEIKKILTEPYVRDAENLVREVIKGYALPWSVLEKYLREEVDYVRSPLCRPTLLKDHYTVWLPRKLEAQDWKAIDNLRVKDPRQEKRVRERPDKSQSRDLGSDEENE